MDNLSLRALVLSGCAVFIASCGGGGDGDKNNNNPDNAILYSNCGNSPNYAAELGSFRMLRWKQFPLTVAIDLTNAPRVSEGNNRQVYTSLIQAAASSWDVGGGIGAVSFVTSGNADIVIRFNNIAPGLGGITNYQVMRPYISGVTIDLSVYFIETYLARGGAGPGSEFQQQLRGITAHEMGHALFAGAHPTRVLNSLMGGSPLQGFPQQLDINTIRESYCSSGIRPATPGTVSGQ